MVGELDKRRGAEGGLASAYIAHRLLSGDPSASTVYLGSVFRASLQTREVPFRFSKLKTQTLVQDYVPGGRGQVAGKELLKGKPEHRALCCRPVKVFR